MMLLICFLLLISPLFGKTILVPQEKANILSGINAAMNGDTVLVAAGTYTGSGNRGINFYGKAITVLSKNGPNSTIIDCENVDRGFIFETGETNDSRLDGFTIQNGYGDYYHSGGGILCGTYPWIPSSPVIINCKIKNCYSDKSGGGIYSYCSNELKIINCEITDNQTANMGGGIVCNSDSPTIDHCIITGNVASGGGSSYDGGGGIYCTNSSKAVITNCVISGNRTNDVGGGICIKEDSNPDISNCIIKENWSKWSGGGIYCSHAAVEISNCLISFNHSDFSGGGILCGYDHVPTVIRNCIISNNTALDEGGGVDLYHSDASLINCTIFKNSATTIGGGINCYNSNYGSNPKIKSCILWNNTPDEIYLYNCSPVVTYCDIQGGWKGTGNIDANPRFVSYKGFDLLLRPQSPCIDTGDPAIQDYLYDWHPKCPEWYKDGARSDMGAYGGPGNKYWINIGRKPISEKAKKE